MDTGRGREGKGEHPAYTPCAPASADSPSISLSRGHYYSFHLAGKEIILLRSDNAPRSLALCVIFFSP